MAPHFVRAQSAYKDIRTRTHARTYTQKKTTDQYAEENRLVFIADLKERVKMNV